MSPVPRVHLASGPLHRAVACRLISPMSEITSFLQLPKDRLNGRFTLLFLEYNEYLLQVKLIRFEQVT